MLKMEKLKFIFYRNYKNMFRGKWLGNPLRFYDRHVAQYSDLHLCDEGDLYVI